MWLSTYMYTFENLIRTLTCTMQGNRHTKQNSMALRRHIVGQILALKPRYVPGIPSPMGRGIQMTGA